jgi:hypothetical protein
MPGKAVISLTTGLEDPEKVTVAFLVAVGAAESGRPVLMFLTKEAVRLAMAGTATGVACDGWRPLLRLPDLLHRQEPQPGLSDRRGRAPGNHPAVGMDRRRSRHHLQLLMKAMRRSRWLARLAATPARPRSRSGSPPVWLAFVLSACDKLPHLR